MYSVDIDNPVRRACLKDSMSAREAAQYFNKDRKTISKKLRHTLPPGYRRSEVPHRPTLDYYVGVIDEIMRTDKALIKSSGIQRSVFLNECVTNTLSCSELLLLHPLSRSFLSRSQQKLSFKMVRLPNY